MPTYGWKLADDQGNPLTAPGNWNSPQSWIAYPVSNPPTTGIVPSGGDAAFVVAGTVNVSTFFGSFSNSYPVTIDITDSRALTTLGLGGLFVTGVLPTTFGTPTVFPTIDINGGALVVSGDILDTFSGTIAVPTPLGTQIASGTPSGGGTIDLDSKGSLEIGGTAGAAITVDFKDGLADVLKLDSVAGAAPGAFAGSIVGFTTGDTIQLSTLTTSTHFIASYAAGQLTLTDFGLGTLAATLNVVGSYTTDSFAINSGAAGTAITIATAVAPPSAPDLRPAFDSGASNIDNVTKYAAMNFSGSAAANATVTLLDGGTVIGTGTATAAGIWVIASSKLSDGTHSIAATQTDGQGHTSAASAALSVTVDTAAPVAPSAPDLLAASDTGASSTDNITSITTPTFAGTAEAGSTVTLFDAGKSVGTAKADAGTGAWTIQTTALADGFHNILATATDLAGNGSPASALLTVRIDTTAPAPPSAPDLRPAFDSGASNTDNVTKYAAMNFSGSAAANATVTLLDGGTVIGTGTATAAGIWVIASSKLSDGTHSIAATQTDGQGHTSAASAALSVTVDTTAPIAPSAPDLLAAADTGASSTDNITSITTPTFVGTAEAGSTVTLFDAGKSVGTAQADAGTGAWTIKTTALADGLHNIIATATDLAGNGSPASALLTVRIDATAPAAPSAPDLAAASDNGASNTDNITSVTTPIFTGTAEIGSKVTLLDAGKSIGTATAAAGTGAWSITSSALGLGAHSIAATATDAAGNVGASSAPLSVSIVTAVPTNDVHWINASGGNFANQFNWNPQRIPLPTDNAIIDAAGTYVIGSAVNETVKTLAMQSKATLVVATSTFTVSSGSGTGGLAGTININDTAALALGGIIVNSGTINEGAINGPTNIQLVTPSVTLQGGGHINLSNNANNLITPTGVSNLLSNVDNVIAGAGTIGTAQMVLVNQAKGIVNANQKIGLTLDTGANFINNSGILESTNSGGLLLNSVVDNSNGGTITAIGPFGVVNLASTVIGGTLTTAGVATIRTVGASAVLNGQGLHQLTNTGQVVVTDAGVLTLLGAIKNAGTIAVASTGDATNLVIGGPIVTLTGGGQIALSNLTTNQIIGAAPSNLLNNVDNTISGAGQLGLGQLSLQNSGIINANKINALVLNTGGNVTFNTGTIQSTNSGGLTIQSTVVDNGGGTIQATVAGSHVDLAGGTIMGGVLHTNAGGVIQTSGGGTLDGLSDGAVTSDAMVVVKDGEFLTLLGTIVNNGTISEQSVAQTTDLHLGSTNVVLQGKGRLTLSSSVSNRIVGNAGNFRLVNVSNTIDGAGQIGVGQMRLTNQAGGVINADQAATKTTPATLTLNTGASVIINAGLMEATNTGGLVLQSNVNNSGGTILAAGSGAHVDLAGAAIEGGTLATSGGGVIGTVAGNGTLDGLTVGQLNNTGTVIVRDGTVLTLQGTINNTGTINLNAATTTTEIAAASPAVTLTGGGAVLLSNNVNNLLLGGPGVTTLVNVNNTIAGAGQIGVSQLAFVNQASGIVNANQNLALVLNPAGNNFTNAGILESTNTLLGNGGLVIQSGLVNNAGGTIQALGANTHVNLTGATITGGTLATSGGGIIQTVAGNGTLDGLTAGQLNNTGTIAVNDATVLTLQGTINNTGTINLNAATTTTEIVAASPAVTLTGGGAVLLSNNVNNLLLGGPGVTTLVNVDNTIAGAGQIGVSQLAFANQAAGIVNANQKLALVLSPVGNDFTNAGILESTSTLLGNGGLVIQSGVVDNGGGTIQAIGANSHVDLAGGTITGGTLKTSGIGVIQTVAGNGTLDGSSDGLISNTGLVRVNNGTVLSLIGGIKNTGTISLQGAAQTTDIQLASPIVTLSGGGLVTLSNSVNNRIFGLTPTARLINLDNTIAGSGQIGVGQMSLVNNGTINANAVNALVIGVGSQASLNTAQGLIEGNSPGGVTFASGVVTNNGTVLAGDGSRITYQAGVINTNIAGGALFGGTWIAQANGHVAAVSVTGGPVSANAATIILSGAGSLFRAGDGNTFATLEQTLTTITSGGVLEVLNGRGYATNLNFTDNGTLQLGGGAFSAATMTVVVGSLSGFGSLTTTSKTVTNGGTIEATGGTLTVSGAVNGGGTLQADAGATLSLTAVAPSNAATVLNNGTIAIGAGGGLAVSGSVDAASTGIFQLNTNSLLEIAANTGSGDKISFLGASTLTVDQASQFGSNVGLATYTGPQLQNFGVGDHIVMKDLVPTGLTLNYSAATGVLQVVSGAQNVGSLLFQNASLGAGQFQLKIGGDGAGHALILHG